MSINNRNFKNFINKEINERTGFVRIRKNHFSISDERINELYHRYFSNIAVENKEFNFKVYQEDLEELVNLLRVHFQLWIEIVADSITIYREFPRRFRLLEEVNAKNHWFTPKSFPKGTILYYGLDHYSVCNRAKGIPLSETPPNRELNINPLVVQINYDFIEVIDNIL